MVFIQYIFYLLAILVPLVFYPYSSELFEFNKMLVVYIGTIAIIGFWSYECIKQKKLVFKRTPLDIPIAIFLASQLISTLLSIDIRTSFFGYYSRFNGGLLSIVSYVTLYWAFVNFMNKDTTIKFIKALILTTFIASLYAALEHFGYSMSCLAIGGFNFQTSFNVNCWVQDVQNRVYGTFGQPNWLAAWLAAVIPLTLYEITRHFNQLKRVSIYIVYSLVSVSLFIITLHYTKSRSGILGLIVALSVYFTALFVTLRSDKKSIKYFFSIFTFVLVVCLSAVLFIKSPWQINFLNKEQSALQESEQSIKAPDLEVNITPSGDIRRVVWKGAIELFKKYPLFGSGVETFAMSYYQTRPVEHNVLSEWNFLYNKAHNEYLNYLSTTGITGFVAYAFLILSTLYLLVFENKKLKLSKLRVAAISGYLSILVTNFFGFSVVPVNFIFYLTPALVLANKNRPLSKTKQFSKLDDPQRTLMFLALVISLYFFYLTGKYWAADYHYSLGVNDAASGKMADSVKELTIAVKYFPNEPIYSIELANQYAKAAAYFAENSKKDAAAQNIAAAESALALARGKYNYNVKLIKQVANIYSELSKVDPKYLVEENTILNNLTKLAPTDASTSYRLATNLAKLGKVDESIAELKKTIEMKPNYKLARRLLGYIYEDTNKPDLAREQYEYILSKIDPTDKNIQADLEKLEN